MTKFSFTITCVGSSLLSSRSYPVLSQYLYKKNKNLFQCILFNLHILLFGHLDYSGTSLRRRAISSSLKHVTVCIFSCAYNSMPCIQWVLFKYWNLILPQSPGILIVLQWNSCWKLEKNNALRHIEIIPHSVACSSSMRLLGKA